MHLEGRTSATATIPPGTSQWQITYGCLALTDVHATMTYQVSQGGRPASSATTHCAGDRQVSVNLFSPNPHRPITVGVRIEPSPGVTQAYAIISPMTVPVT